MDSARKRAEEALAHMEDCLVTNFPPAEWDVRAYASALRALLAETAAHGSSSTVRSDDPPAAPLPTCQACGSNLIMGAPAADPRYVYLRVTRPEGYEDVHPDLVLADMAVAECWEVVAVPAPPAASDAVREAAERLRVSLRIRESRSWCGNRGCDAVRLEAEALLDAIAASPATQERIDHAAEEELERPAAKGGE